jgi:hypothetical protein
VVVVVAAVVVVVAAAVVNLAPCPCEGGVVGFHLFFMQNRGVNSGYLS